MAFELKPDESVKKGIRRIVRSQLKRALKDLEKLEDSVGEGEPVHSLRKRFKRLRAVCRLVRDEAGKKTYKRRNRQFREAGKPLTEVRDCEVLVETLDNLVRESGGRIPSDAAARVRQMLESRQQQIRRQALQEGDTIGNVARIVKDGLDRVNGWRIRGGWSAIRPGLERGYTHCQRAGAAAAINRSVENLHEWRKQAKYFWHQLQLVAPTNPDVLNPMADAIHELTKRLGDDHDLAVLEQTISENKAAENGSHAAEPALVNFVTLIEPRRAELQKQAFELEQQLFAGPVNAFLDRLHGYWQTWRMADNFVPV